MRLFAYFNEDESPMKKYIASFFIGLLYKNNIKYIDIIQNNGEKSLSYNIQVQIKKYFA